MTEEDMTTFTHYSTHAFKRMRRGGRNFSEKKASRVANLGPFYSLSSLSEKWSSGPEFLQGVGGYV